MKWWTFVIVLGIVLMCTCLGACKERHEKDDDVSVSVPIHMEVPTTNLQPRMGLSGFILGSFLMLNAYVVIIASCILLIIRDTGINKFITSLKIMLQVMSPTALEGKAMLFLGQLSDNDRRVQVGTIGLVSGVLLAYFGAWIAL